MKTYDEQGMKYKSLPPPWDGDDQKTRRMMEVFFLITVVSGGMAVLVGISLAGLTLAGWDDQA